MKKIIYFDWDGTLQSKKVSEYANIQRTKMFAKNLNEEELVKLQHNSNNDHYEYVQSLMREVLPIEDKNELKVFQGVLFGFHYMNYVRENKDNILLFDPDKFRELKKKHNLELVIVTSLYESTIKTVLKIHDLDDLFDAVYACPVDLSTTKLDNLKTAIENKNGNEPYMMIGDRGEDVNSGKKFKLQTIYCNYGHGIDDLDADFIIEKPEDLINTIEKVL